VVRDRKLPRHALLATDEEEEEDDRSDYSESKQRNGMVRKGYAEL
jgi:hypothetical protein